MADDSYISLPIESDFDAVSGDMLDYLSDNIDGYVPREGHLDVWLVEAVARQIVETLTTAAQVPPAIFGYFGRSALAIAPIEEAYARIPSTWTVTDIQGHTITAGTLVRYDSATGPVFFRVESDVVVAPGMSTTANGEVTLVAVEPGVGGNGLPVGQVTIMDALVWVDQVTTTAVSSGGVDAESDSDYLDRLRAELRLLSPRPILIDDFAVLARRQAGVDRAFAIDGYNPTNLSYNNERMVTVALADIEGSPVAEPVKLAVASYLDGLREINFSVFVIDPTYYDIDVTVTVAKTDDADAETVRTACEQALESYLNPATWAWNATVRRNELIALLDRVEGVDYVETPSLPAGDVALTGPAPLAQARTVLVTVA